MESLYSKNQSVKYLLCVIDIFTIYALVKPSKDKNGKTILNAFIKIVNEYSHQPNNYGLMKKENFTINLWESGYRIMKF